MTSVGEGSLAVGRLFKTARVKLCCYWAGYRGLYELSCRRFLALVKGEGEASGAYAGGAYIDGACVDGAYADKAYIGGACADGAYIGGVAY